MRHFAHHIGDYAAATAHLTFVEDAAYHRLLRRYYQDEKALPVDPADCQRLIGARSRDEKAAVRTILPEFFELRDDGWHQKRADEEIAAYLSRVDVARNNGRKSGGRPKPKDKPNGNQQANQVGSPPEPDKVTNHKPLTTNQEPIAAAEPLKVAAREEPPDSLTIPPHLDRRVDAAFAEWQSGASGHGWPDAQFLTSSRRYKLQAALATCGGLDGWKAALDRASEAGFLLDDQEQFHRWFTLDWLIDEDHLARLLEGRYADRRETNEQRRIRQGKEAMGL